MTITVTQFGSLAVQTPENPTTGRTFAVYSTAEPKGFIKRRVSNIGYGASGSLESKNLGGGNFAHYDVVESPDDATEFRTRDEAGLLHFELIRPGRAVIVCVDRN